MKEKIHPKSEEVTITCTCGAKIETLSTLGKDFSIELCSKCHPFFTGKKRVVDTAGRVERFKQRAARGGQYGKKATPKKK